MKRQDSIYGVLGELSEETAVVWIRDQTEFCLVLNPFFGTMDFSASDENGIRVIEKREVGETEDLHDLETACIRVGSVAGCDGASLAR